MHVYKWKQRKMSLPCQINSPEFLLPLEDLNIVVEIDAYK